MNYVIKAPAGSGRGQRAVRTDTTRSESGGTWTDGREAGEGAGNGLQVAQAVLSWLFCPRREREGAASRPDGLDPSVSEGESPDGREAGEGAGVGMRAVETFNDYDK